MSAAPGRGVRLVAGLVLLAAIAAVYLPGLPGDFVFDDFANIVSNTRIHATSIDADSLSRAAIAYQGPVGRPLATVGFAIDHAIGQGSPVPFKVHNIIVQALVALLVLAFCSRLFADGGPPAPPGAPARAPWPRWTALAIATAWAVHPIQVSTVLYIVQRMEMLASLFMMLSLLAYLAGRRRQAAGRRGWPWIVAAMLAAGIGLFAKENAVLTPLFALALELTVLRFGAASDRDSRRWKLAHALVVAVGTIGFLALVVPRYGAAEGFAMRDFDAYERVVSQFRVLPMYLGQALLPLPDSLLFYYDNFPKSTGLLSPPTTLAGAVLLAALLVAAWVARRSMPVFSLGVFWFFAAHALTSNAVNLELAFEHRNHLALLGVLLAVAGLLRALPFRLNADGRGLAVAAMVGALALLALLRSVTWSDPLVLAMDMAGRNPTSSRASSDLGAIYARHALDQGGGPFQTLAEKEFERGSRLPGASTLPDQGLILLAAGTGQEVRDDWWDRLQHKLHTRPIGPQESMTVTGLISNRLQGVPLDDRRLAETYLVLVERGGLRVDDYLAYAQHADRILGDEELATRMYVEAMASPRMSRDRAERLLGALVADGKLAYFRAAAIEAERRGLVD